MKKLLMGLLILSVTTTVFAQNDRNSRRNRNMNQSNNTTVPDPVRQSFQRDNPNVRDPQWSNTNGQWRGVYKDRDNKDVETYYENDGRRVDTHIRYNQTELPPQVRDRAERRYHTTGNYDAYRIERPNSQPLFQLRIQSGRTIYLDENGRKRRYRDRH
jgi:hypothetical protein